MAKSKKSRIYNSEIHYERVLSRLSLANESGGDQDLRSVELWLRRIIDGSLTRFEIVVTVNGEQELTWATDVPSINDVAHWFVDAAKLLEGSVEELKKGGLRQDKR